MANHKKRKRRAWMPPMENTELVPFNNASVLNMNDAPDELKLSAKLIEVMTPWIDEIDLATLANCAALAWNASVSGVDSYTNQDFLRGGSPEDSSDHKALIEKLKRRKNKLYPDDLRTIIRMQVREDEQGDSTIVVASELKPENMFKMLARLASLGSDENDEQ